MFPKISDYLHMAPVALAVMRELDAGGKPTGIVLSMSNQARQQLDARGADEEGRTWQLIDRVPGMLLEPKGAAAAELGGPYYIPIACADLDHVMRFLRRAGNEQK